MKKTTKQILAFVMVAAVALTSIVVNPSLSKSAKKPALSKKSASIAVGETVKIKVKNAKKTAKVTWKTTDKKVVKIAKKVAKGKKAYAKVKGVAAGKATVKAIYKAGKTKSTLKCKVTVTAAADVATDSALTVVATGTPAPVKGTATPAPAKGTATPKPTATPKATKTPRATATPRFTEPASIPSTVDVKFESGSQYIVNEYDMATLTYNTNGSLTIVFDQQWAAVDFYLPDTAETYYSAYKSVTVEYTSSGNALGHALYDKDAQFGDGKNSDDGTEPGKHPDWDKQITTGNSVTKTFTAGSDFAGGCLRGIQIFNPNESGSTTITITKITFKK